MGIKFSSLNWRGMYSFRVMSFLSFYLNAILHLDWVVSFLVTFGSLIDYLTTLDRVYAFACLEESFFSLFDDWLGSILHHLDMKLFGNKYFSHFFEHSSLLFQLEQEQWVQKIQTLWFHSTFWVKKFQSSSKPSFDEVAFGSNSIFPSL